MAMCNTLARDVCAIECYQGVYMEPLDAVVTRFPFDLIINSDDLFKSQESIEAMPFPGSTSNPIKSQKPPDIDIEGLLAKVLHEKKIISVLR